MFFLREIYVILYNFSMVGNKICMHEVYYDMTETAENLILLSDIYKQITYLHPSGNR